MRLNFNRMLDTSRSGRLNVVIEEFIHINSYYSPSMSDV